MTPYYEGARLDIVPLGEFNKKGVMKLPHVEHMVMCKCGYRYCVICHPSGCPECHSIHIQGNGIWHKLNTLRAYKMPHTSSLL